MSIKRKYVDSHWLFFSVKGVVALLFGWFVNFSNTKDPMFLMVILSVTLLGLGIIELLNLLHRTHLKNTWGLALIMALLEITASLAILFTLNHNLVLHLTVLSVYTLSMGILEILLSIKSIDDRTDKAIWGISGICGSILGFVILRSGNLDPISFIKFFGIYMIILGVANLIYGVHNRDQAKTLREEKLEKRALNKKSKTSSSNPNKTTKKVLAKKPSKNT